jgi:hypothetical protein
MFVNIFGSKSVENVIEIIKHEIAIDAANGSVGNLEKIAPDTYEYPVSIHFQVVC